MKHKKNIACTLYIVAVVNKKNRVFIGTVGRYALNGDHIHGFIIFKKKCVAGQSKPFLDEAVKEKFKLIF